MEISWLIDVVESIARAISAEEGFRLTMKSKLITTAYIEDVNYLKKLSENARSKTIEK